VEGKYPPEASYNISPLFIIIFPKSHGTSIHLLSLVKTYNPGSFDAGNIVIKFISVWAAALIAPISSLPV